MQQTFRGQIPLTAALVCPGFDGLRCGPVDGVERAVNALYLRLRRRLQTWCPVPADLDGAVELDGSSFGPRRVRGKTIAFGLFKRGGHVCTEIVPDCSKKTLQAIVRGKIDVAAMVNTDGWRCDDGLVDVGFDRHFRGRHGQDEFVFGASHLNGIESC